MPEVGNAPEVQSQRWAMKPGPSLEGAPGPGQASPRPGVKSREHFGNPLSQIGNSEIMVYPGLRDGNIGTTTTELILLGGENVSQGAPTALHCAGLFLV